jgi:hypothetical protein
MGILFADERGRSIAQPLGPLDMGVGKGSGSVPKGKKRTWTAGKKGGIFRVFKGGLRIKKDKKTG